MEIKKGLISQASLSTKKDSTKLKNCNTLEFKKNRFIEKYIKRGLSIIPVNDNKLPCIQWKEYQERRAEPEEIYKWYFDYPGFNVGIITGSLSHFYSLDFDTYEAFKVFPDEYKNSSLTETKRGLHLNFLSERSYPGKILNIKDYKVEFKGTGQYVIEPYANIEGFEYKVINPLSMIKDLPNFIEDLLLNEKLLTKDTKQISWSYNGKQACIKQILSRELIEGERERTLFILYSLLIRNRNSEEYARAFVIRKNNLLRNPLPGRELMSIFKGTSYNSLGCGYVKSNLPYISCKGCPYLKEATMDFQDVYYRKDLTETDKKVFYELKVWDKTEKREIAKDLEINEREVYRSIERLKKKGIL